jgi:hypothetical protein
MASPSLSKIFVKGAAAVYNIGDTVGKNVFAMVMGVMLEILY